MSEKVQGGMGATIVGIVCSLVIGGVVGYYGNAFLGGGSVAAASGRSAGERSPMGGGGAPAMGGGGGGGMMGGGGGGGMMGGRGGGPPSGAAALPRLVRNLATIEAVQGKGLTAQQKSALLPVLKDIQSASTLTDKDCDAKIDQINKILGDPQQQAIKDMTPQRGGRGGGGMMGGGGGGMMGGGGGRGGGGMMGGGGGQAADNKPFASDRNKKPLDDLIADAGGK